MPVTTKISVIAHDATAEEVKEAVDFVNTLVAGGTSRGTHSTENVIVSYEPHYSFETLPDEIAKMPIG